MKRDEFKQKITDLMGIATPENQARASEILTELSEGFENVMSESESLASKVKELTENNETLRSVNAKLFLKVGATDKQTVHTEEDNTQTNSELDNLTFNKLFNEKGELI